MQANKPYISTGLRHIFAIVSSQISTMMEPVNAILKHEPANRRLEISPRDISFLSSLSIIHDINDIVSACTFKFTPFADDTNILKKDTAFNRNNY